MNIASTFLAVLLASSLACIVTSFGIYVIYSNADWGNRNVAYFMSFAADVLISVSLMHISPESISMKRSITCVYFDWFYGHVHHKSLFNHLHL